MKIRSALFFSFDDAARKAALIERAEALGVEAHTLTMANGPFRPVTWTVTVYPITNEQAIELQSLTITSERL